MPRSRRAASAQLPTFNIDAFELAFHDFLNHVTIVSKDTGRGRIKLFNVQKVLLSGGYGQIGIFESLRQGRHWVVTLKARQLGSTTISLLLDIFWAAMFPGLQGAIVVDTDPNKEKIRLLLSDVLENLPPGHELPVKKHNRNGILFETPGGDSMIDYLVAGTRTTGGNLGRSRALNFCHITEASSYGDVEGFESLKDTFSEIYPYRFYHEESTARGFNIFNDEWEDAEEDTLTKTQIFLAWWMHEQYQHKENTSYFQRYGYPELDEDEKKTSDIVFETYGHRITLEQWAWYRHKRDPRARGDIQLARSNKEELVEQEYPSYPEQAFIETGSPFVPGTFLTPMMAQAVATKFYGFRYRFGETVLNTIREPVDFSRQAQLKVYQLPVEGAVYVIAADAAFASDDESDQYCIQVIRCYADRVEQVAEFCVRNMQTYEFTWVIIDLCAWYNECRYLLEINASGEAVATEFRHLKTQIESGRLTPARADPEHPTKDELQVEHDTRSMLSRVRRYLYRRPDTLSGGYNLHWKTTAQNKHAIMVQLRDRIALKEIRINSTECLKETKTLRQEGFSIKAEGNKKDDRPVALALAVRCWIDQERSNLVALGRTYAYEHAGSTQPEFNTNNYLAGLIAGEIAGKVKMREKRQRAGRRQRWGW